MKRLWSLLIPLLALGAAPTTQPASPIVIRAHHILETMKSSTYQHSTDIDPAAGRYNCDCSGLISYLLKQDLPRQYGAVPFPKAVKHPRAVEFYEAFVAAPAQPSAGNPWQHVERFANARPGDILAWRKEPLPTKGNTGHIVLLDSLPKPIAENLFEVVVIDSTSFPHHDDTRPGKITGVGRGTIFVKTDADGHLLGYASKSPQGPFLINTTAVARPIPLAN